MAQGDIIENLSSWDKLERYSEWIYHMYAKHIGNNILDVGGGIGTAISFYIDKAERIISTELFDAQIAIMNERFKEFPYFKAIKADITKDDFSKLAPFDTIILINVLEHIEDDLQMLVNLGNLLTQNGKIIICVPAVSRLYCYMDKNVGHYRRYDKGELYEKAVQADLNVVEDRYMNFMGLFPYWIKGHLKKESEESFSTSIKKSESKLYSIATSIMEPIERIINPPIGISEFIIMSKS